jgi:hypothetical protein
LFHCKQEVDTDNFESWEKLIRACEAQEGGLNRNSSPQALATLRDVYDRFLLKFPLLFGYWKKYADLEFNISGPESAEMVSAGPATRAPLPIRPYNHSNRSTRSTNADVQALRTASISGHRTAPLRWKPPTPPIW